VEFVAQLLLTGPDGSPADAPVALEAYEIGPNAWRPVTDILKPFRVAPKVSRDGGRLQIAFTINDVISAALFGTTAFFRLVAGPQRQSGQAQVIVASERVVSNRDRVELDFGNVLFLGERGGFVTVAGDGGIFCSAIALAAEDEALAAAQRRFYGGARETQDTAAERDRALARAAELEKANVAARKALADCEATGARLSRDNAALSQQAQGAAADLQACALERGKLGEQLAAATARAGTAEANLKSLTAERDRLATDLAARTKSLASVTSERDACATERGKLAEQLATATARAATAETGLKACTAERERAAAELAARTKSLADTTAERDACVTERGRLTEQLAAATARAATAESGLKTCTVERERAVTDLAARTKSLASVTSERDACATERGKLADQLAAATARAATAETGLKACTAERERAAAELAARTKALADATAERDSCAQAREALIAELDEARTGLDSAGRQLKVLQAGYRDEGVARALAERDLEACRARTAALDASVSECAAALEACRASGTEAQSRTNEAEQAATALQDRLAAMDAEARLRNEELNELRGRETDERAYVGRLKDSLLAESAKATAAADQLEAVRRQQRSEGPTTQMIAGIATSFAEVNRQLIASDMPYRLGRTDVRLKTILSGAGDRMYFPDAGHRIEDAPLSEVTIELIPDDAPVAPAPGGLIVPDLLGLTETAVIRILSSLFLKAERAVESTNDEAKHGRALHQIPKPGESAERGQTVLVVYGAKKGT